MATQGIQPPNRRLPWRDALAALIAFAALGAAVLDDYGVGWDEHWQRNLGQAAIAYARWATPTPCGPTITGTTASRSRRR